MDDSGDSSDEEDSAWDDVDEYPHTAEKISEAFSGVLNSFPLDPKKGFKTTDRGANVKASFEEEEWINGLAHALNLAQQAGFKAACDAYKPLRKLFKRVKRVVRYIRKKKIQTSKKLIQGIKTRWNYYVTFIMRVFRKHCI